MFSGTSSQVHFLIQAAATLLIFYATIDNNIKEAIQNIIDFTKHNIILSEKVQSADRRMGREETEEKETEIESTE